jgi:hypothetical protein
MIMELLALSIKVRRTYISKVLLGFLPPYPLMTAKKNEEAKSKKTKHNHLELYHKALQVVLNDLLHLEKNKDDVLQVDIPGLGIVYLHVRLAFVVGDIKGQNPMACHYGAFSANIKEFYQCATVQQHRLISQKGNAFPRTKMKWMRL